MSYLLQFRAVALQTCSTALILLSLLLMLHTQLLNTHTDTQTKEMRWTQLIHVDILNHLAEPAQRNSLQQSLLGPWSWSGLEGNLH